MAETVTFPHIAQERINAFRLEIASLEKQMQQFADGVLVGLGVDMVNNDISVDLGTMTVTITPKKGADDSAAPEE